MKILAFFIFIFSALLCGCTSVYKSPELISSKTNEIVILEPRNYTKGDVFFISRIDGNPPGFGWFRRFELSPGVHSVTASPNAMRVSSKPITRSFLGVAGVKYEFVYLYEETEYKKGMWSFLIIDTRTGKDIAY